MPVKLNRLKKTKQSNTCAVGILLCLLSLTALFNILFNGNRQKKQCLGFGVLSSSLNSQRRNAIRNGWGKHPGVCRLTFFVAINSDLALMEKVRETSCQSSLMCICLSVFSCTYHLTLSFFRFLERHPRRKILSW